MGYFRPLTRIDAIRLSRTFEVSSAIRYWNTLQQTAALKDQRDIPFCYHQKECPIDMFRLLSELRCLDELPILSDSDHQTTSDPPRCLAPCIQETIGDAISEEDVPWYVAVDEAIHEIV